MLQFLLDTDHLTLFQYKHPSLMRQIAAHPAGALGISPISIEETHARPAGDPFPALTGVAHIQAYANLVSAVEMLTLFPVVPFDRAGEGRFQQLRAARLRVGTQDLKIASIALENNLTLLTRNNRDFGRIPGLVLADWSV